MKNLFVRLFVAATLLVPASVNAQVTIGSGKVPESFSVLELDNPSNNPRGLRLPRLSETDLETLKGKLRDLQGEEAAAAQGLRVYNTDKDCVWTWNGEAWIKWGCEEEEDPCTANSAIIGRTSVCAEETETYLIEESGDYTWTIIDEDGDTGWSFEDGNTGSSVRVNSGTGNITLKAAGTDACFTVKIEVSSTEECVKEYDFGQEDESGVVPWLTASCNASNAIDNSSSNLVVSPWSGDPYTNIVSPPYYSTLQGGSIQIEFTADYNGSQGNFLRIVGNPHAVSSCSGTTNTILQINPNSSNGGMWLTTGAPSNSTVTLTGSTMSGSIVKECKPCVVTMDFGTTANLGLVAHSNIRIPMPNSDIPNSPDNTYASIGLGFSYSMNSSVTINGILIQTADYDSKVWGTNHSLVPKPKPEIP